jgi:hypothetical protein
MKPAFLIALAFCAALSAACGRDEPAPALKGAEPSAGTKGPGPVDRGAGSGEGATVGESQNRDTRSGGATSGSR